MFNLHFLVTHDKNGLYNSIYLFIHLGTLHCVKYLNRYNSGCNGSLYHHWFWWKLSLFNNLDVMQLSGLFPAAAAEVQLHQEGDSFLECMHCVFLTMGNIWHAQNDCWTPTN